MVSDRDRETCVAASTTRPQPHRMAALLLALPAFTPDPGGPPSALAASALSLTATSSVYSSTQFDVSER